MNLRTPFAREFLIAVWIVLLSVSAVWAQSYAHARVVRLSFVEGSVTVQRPDLQAWAEAPVNTPLQEGFTLSTGESSFAEIQFENGGTIRLGEHSVLAFTALGLAPDGGKINHVDLRQGYATFHPLPSRLGESLQVSTPHATLNAQGGTRFRVDLDQGLERVEVFHGAVDVQSNLGDLTLEKDFVLIMQPGSSDPTVVSQGITKDDWDQWVDDRESHMDMPSSGPSPSSYEGEAGEAPYGWSDLQQYGSWSSVPGAGYGWTPASVAAGWSPYSFGQWCWYPGWGYTWIGAEPWGWLPYHYGWWEFIAGIGWVWFPGSFRTWSPHQVTWYQGPNWLGWIPRPRRKDDGSACGNHCGGGVVSTDTFRHGGLLTSSLMLGFSPTSGERVKEPGIIPSTAAKLPGPVVSSPPAKSHGYAGPSAHAPVKADIAGTATPGSPHPAVKAGTPGGPTSSSAHAGLAPPNSSIVYDPQHDRYVNSHRVATPPPSPPPSTSPTPARALPTPAANPGLYPPVPVGSREPNARPSENPGLFPPNAAGNPYARPAPSPARSEPRESRPARSEGPAAGSHVGGGGPPAGGHPSPAPAAGGHVAAPPPAGGGHR